MPPISGPSSGLPESSRPGIARSRSDLDHRLVERPRRAAGAPREREVQPDVAGLGQQRQQRLHRRALLGGDQVVVVDHDEHLGAGPPRPVAQLVGRDVGAGERLLEVRREVGERGRGLGRAR